MASTEEMYAVPPHHHLADWPDIHMRRWMIPIVGFVFIVVLTAIAGMLATRGARSFRLLKWVLLLHVVIQMVGGILLLATDQWEWAAQLSLTSIFGLFATVTLGVDYLAVYSAVCLFNLLGLLGRLNFFNYNVSLYDHFDAHSTYCLEYWGLAHTDHNNLCNHYLGFSRVLAYMMVWLVAAQVFVSYYLYKERSLDFGSVTASATTKTRETYGAIGSEDYGTIGARD